MRMRTRLSAVFGESSSGEVLWRMASLAFIVLLRRCLTAPLLPGLGRPLSLLGRARPDQDAFPHQGRVSWPITCSARGKGGAHLRLGGGSSGVTVVRQGFRGVSAGCGVLAGAEGRVCQAVDARSLVTAASSRTASTAFLVRVLSTVQPYGSPRSRSRRHSPAARRRVSPSSSTAISPPTNRRPPNRPQHALCHPFSSVSTLRFRLLDARAGGSVWPTGQAVRAASCPRGPSGAAGRGPPLARRAGRPRPWRPV